MNNTSPFDVIIVGSGAGGSAAAYGLTQAGYNVLMLEAGPRFNPATDYPLSNADWELSRFPLKPGSQGQYTFAPMQKLEPRWQHLRSKNTINGYLSNQETRIPSDAGYHHVRGLGGSTLQFTGESHRLHQDAMNMHSRFNVAADWPLSYQDLMPYYNQAEKLIGVAGDTHIVGRDYTGASLLPPHPFADTSRILQRGAAKLGLHWQANNRAALSHSYDGRPSCNYCHNCNRGCPRGDKGSADVTFIRRASLTNRLTIKTDLSVIKLENDGNQKISGVICGNHAGQRFSFSAPIIILACGAIETPRLLLNSADTHSPEGLGNESGQVGQHFMETLSWTLTGMSDAPLQTFKGLPADGICWDFNAPDSIPNIIGGCRFSSTTAEADLSGPVNYARRLVAGWGAEFKASMRQQFGQAVSVGAIGESLPNAGSFIDLDATTQDEHGLALAQIHSFLPDTELKRLEFMAQQCSNILQASGITEIVESYGSYDLFSSTHVFGTCRMGYDPLTSVTNPVGRSHRWQNLYICDASLFPSSGGGESPSLTIEALALRMASSL
ncbi:GMC family oxidoreductase [Amphritea sp. 1_MG-2023]|uniref:GMC oxidoreductase n=1 Tax=Amphritea sp. 1_MG-2023 TaxID=3062670 RepID=UPI0026E2F66A|nr:GMC family oxidoreductase [Amphritea sp. 1_MG-2023]MDO6562180.1 GMC family oxidoreductase [Amphritea sp. 1_MG-2023]